MAWFSGKVSLGSLPDLAGAVNKISESVKNLEKNLDGAFGVEEKSDSSTATVTAAQGSGSWPVMTFMGQKSEDPHVESSWKSGSPQKLVEVEEKERENSAAERSLFEDKMMVEEKGEDVKEEEKDDEHPVVPDKKEAKIPDPEKYESEIESKPAHVEPPESVVHVAKTLDLVNNVQQKEISEVGPTDNIGPEEPNSVANEVHEVEDGTVVHNESIVEVDRHDSEGEHRTQPEKTLEESFLVHAEVSNNDQVEAPSDYAHTKASSDTQAEAVTDPSGSQLGNAKEHKMDHDSSFPVPAPSDEALEMVSSLVPHENDSNTKKVEQGKQILDRETGAKEQYLNSGSSASDAIDSVLELNKLKLEMKMMETALQGAARQAQAKADEIAKMMNENEHLKAVIEDLKGKSPDAEVESLREEYHHRVTTLERKVYALTKERDTLRREQSKKSDAAALLKEKDEIINQVMAEGEELSKKQAAQEATIRKLRAQIRELEEEKKGLTTKLQVEENKVESIRKDKMATEKLLQETIERHQADLVAQKEYYTNALTAAKEAEALAEALANNEARTELESCLREAEERETMLVQTLKELRQTLSRKEQQAVFQEDVLRRDIEDLQKRYQASERRCEELVTQVPESTRPLMRQINGLQETMARRTEAWNAVERTLNSRLQEAEAKAASAEERERSVNERLSQTLSRINVLEAQISCLRAEQSQLSRSLEKERQRAAENRQDYLAAKEEADTQEGRANQLEEEIKELKQKHKEELQDSVMHRELLQQEIEKEKTARVEFERVAHVQSTAMSKKSSVRQSNSALENGNLSRKLSSASSMEESYFLQASLDASIDSFSERGNPGEAIVSPYFMKSMTPSAFESALCQKEGEIASYMSRLESMESIRDSLAEELVKMTAQCEKLQSESALLPGIRAELESLRRRHLAALELMGERDEELEELRADIVDLKEMYREQVGLLVNKIQIMSSSMGNAG